MTVYAIFFLQSVLENSERRTVFNFSFRQTLEISLKNVDIIIFYVSYLFSITSNCYCCCEKIFLLLKVFY